MKEEETIYRKRELELENLFKRTEWIFEDEKKDVAPRLKKEIYLPDGIDVLKTSSMLDIEVDWRKNVTVKKLTPFIFFTLVWNIMILTMVVGMALSGAFVAILGTVLHMAVGFGMLYYIMSLILNKSRVIVNQDEINIENTPFFRLSNRNKTIKTKDIDQIYVRRERNGSVNGVPNYNYALYVLDKGGKKTRLMRGLNHETLMFLEQELERFIEIKDKKMSDEAKIA